MRILFVLKKPVGGIHPAEGHYFPVTLCWLGHTVGIVAPPEGDDSALKAAGVLVYQLSAGWLSGLRQVTADFRPDVVHVFIHRGCGLLPPALRGVAKPAFILDIRSPLIMAQPGELRRQLVRIKHGLEALPYQAVIGISVKAVRTQMITHHSPIMVTAGIDLGLFTARHQSRDVASPVRLVYVGSVAAGRRLPDLIKAVLLARQSVSVELDVFAVGAGRDELAAEIDRQNAQAVVRICKPLPRAELMQRMVEYDVGLAYVPRAVFDGGPPLKTLEYLAAGLPTLATDTLGNRYFVRHGENGYLAGDSAEDFAAGIVRVAQDTPLRRQLAAAARPSVEPFTWERIVTERLLPVYRRYSR
jgi:glycosyltransferase involved in cell wall biosynthesis